MPCRHKLATRFYHSRRCRSKYQRMLYTLYTRNPRVAAYMPFIVAIFNWEYVVLKQVPSATIDSTNTSIASSNPVGIWPFEGITPISLLTSGYVVGADVDRLTPLCVSHTGF